MTITSPRTTPPRTNHLPAVEVSGLTKTYPGGIEAVKGVSFEVAAGEVLGLLGPNGAGKSTTVGMLTGTVAPTSGSARLAGHDVVSDPLRARHVSAVVFQDTVLDGALTGRRNLAIHSRLWGLDPGTTAARSERLVESFGLREAVDRPVETYSGGQRRRLEIARALLSEPDVLFLDEPTVGLDPRIRHELLDLLAGLRARTDMSILLTTHYLDEAEQLCDRVAIMHEGRVVALDSPIALLTELGTEILELRIDGDATAALRELQEGGLATADAFAVGQTVHVPLRSRPASEALRIVDDLGLLTTTISTRPPNLDDVYLQLTGGSLAANA